VTCRDAEPAALVATHRYVPESFADTRSIRSAPFASTRAAGASDDHDVPFRASSTPSLYHVITGRGTPPLASHDIWTGLLTTAAYSSSSSRRSVGTAAATRWSVFNGTYNTNWQCRSMDGSNIISFRAVDKHQQYKQQK